MFLLGAVIKHHLRLNQGKLSRLVNEVEKSLYVDDYSGGEVDVGKGKILYRQLKDLFHDAGFNLRKWNSNSEELQGFIDEEEKVQIEYDNGAYAQDDRTYSDVTLNAMLHEDSKVLGVKWNQQSDELLVDLKKVVRHECPNPITKRQFLKLASSIYDPLGILAPVVIRLKVLFQGLCKDGGNWDDQLREEVLAEWKTFCDEAKSAVSIRIPRCYLPAEGTARNVMLAGFCDASPQAYAAPLYLREEMEDPFIVHTILIGSKTRVAPLEVQSIPRLELLGALILSWLAKRVL